jgi:predicted SprT family Zn-dependent metalloprotease
MNNTPSLIVSTSLTIAYDHFNTTLFNGKLPDCLIHMHRKAKCYGYFAGDRFGNEAGQKVDEIALNPTPFKDRTIEQSLSTLVHEMVHLWQHHYGDTGRAGYHNKEWAEYMVDVGLQPSSTGAPGGKTTGQKISHYIIEGGDYQQACAALLATGFTLPYIELWDESRNKAKAKSAASKTKFTCPCCMANAWAKPDASLICGTCSENMQAENA